MILLLLSSGVPTRTCSCVSSPVTAVVLVSPRKQIIIIIVWLVRTGTSQNFAVWPVGTWLTGPSLSIWWLKACFSQNFAVGTLKFLVPAGFQSNRCLFPVIPWPVVALWWAVLYTGTPGLICNHWFTQVNTVIWLKCLWIFWWSSCTSVSAWSWLVHGGAWTYQMAQLHHHL